MTDFTNIRAALHSLLDAVHATTAELITTANEQRKELLGLYGRIQATQADIIEFGTLTGEAGAVLLDTEEFCEGISSKIQGVLIGGLEEVPVVNYQDFAGFCAECGEAVMTSEDYELNENDECVCAACIAKQNEQFPVELNESVVHEQTNEQVNEQVSEENVEAN